MKRLLMSVIFFSTTLCVVPVHAALPDAGQLLREQQPQRKLPQQLPKIEGEIERPPLTDSGVRVAVKGFRFSGAEGLVTDAEFQELVADAVGKDLSFAELQSLAGKVTAYLKDKGWFLARAYLPKQDVSGGIVEIAIVQGKSDGSISFTFDKKVRVKEDKVRRIGDTAINAGVALHEQRLERAILLMNDLPGISARASLAAGKTTGTTGINVDVKEGPLFNGSIWGDNQGNRFTGAWRGSSMLNINDPFRFGDQLSLLMTGSEGLIQGRLGYSFPLTATGLKGSFAYTGMHYELVGDLALLKSEGQSHTIDAGVSYPLLRSRTSNINISSGYVFKALTDSANGADIHDKRLHSGSLSLNGDRYDRFFGGGYTTWNAGVTTGLLDLDGIASDAAADQSGPRSAGGYTRFNIGLGRLQRLSERVSLNLSYSSQFSLDNLDSSERFNLGGPSGVRAYSVGEASGDEGHLFNIDIRYDLPLPMTWGAFQLSAFFDAGNITLHHHLWPNAVATSTDKNNYWLSGAGVGLNYNWRGLGMLKFSWANAFGDNPGRSKSGADADGRSSDSRFWLLGIVNF